MTIRILTLALMCPVAAISAFAWVGGPYPKRTGTDPVTAFEKAVQMEEVQGDPALAGLLYMELTGKDVPAGIRIEAEIRVARCLMKQGRTDDAEAGLKKLAGRLRAERLPANLPAAPVPGSPPGARPLFADEPPPASLEVNGRKNLPDDTVGLMDESLDSAMKALLSIPGGADRQRLVEGAIEGMARAVSRHANYLPPAVTKSFEQSFDDSFCGIGAVLAMEEVVKVNQVIPGSPAEAAGIKPESQILEIDGRSAFALGGKLPAVVAAIRGPEGTPVRLLIKPPGGVASEVTVQRARIQTGTEDECAPLGEQKPGTPRTWWVDEGGGIAGVRLKSFFARGKETASGRLKAVLNDPALAGGRVKGFILDLTDNGGGSLEEAVAVADLFLTEGVIVQQRPAGKGDFDTKRANAEQRLAGVPVAVLINERTASAAEVVAAALQHHKRAKVFGVRSYGRGEILSLKSLPGGGSVTVPVAELIAANGQPLERREGMSERDTWGVKPDVVIEGFVNREAGFGLKKLQLLVDGKAVDEADFIRRQSVQQAVEFLKQPDAPR